MKRCNICHRIKRDESYFKDAYGGLRYCCKACYKKKELYHKDIEDKLLKLIDGHIEEFQMAVNN